MTALVGEQVVLPCEAVGDPMPAVQWRRNHLTIDFFDMEHKYLREETGSLIIPHAEVVDTGRYYCIAENAAGRITREINFKVYGVLRSNYFF